MAWSRLPLLVAVIIFLGQQCSANEELGRAVANSLSEKVRIVLEHYKSPDPIGLPEGWPGDGVPDPMPIPNIKPPFSLATLNMFNCTVHGLSQFRIESVFSNLADMQVIAAVRIEKLEVLGNYTLATWLSRSAGGCTVTLNDVYVEGMAVLDVARQGHLEASDIEMDISVNKIALDFSNLGFLASIFQGMMNSVGTFVFDSIKPFILSEVNAKMRGDINTNMRSMKQTFPNSIPPLDLAIVVARNYVKELGYDAYKIPDYSHTAGVFGVYVTKTWLSGLSSFYRVDNITVSMQNNVVQIGLNVATEELKGSCEWELSAAGLYSHLGSTCFTVEYFQVEAKLNQALDTRKHPELEQLELTLGNIQLRHDGTGTLDYALELLVNVLPNLLRYQILDALEEPLKRRIQDVLNGIDVEKTITDKVPELEKLASYEEQHLDNPTMLSNSTTEEEEVGDVTTSTTEAIDEVGLVIGASELDSATF